MAFVVAPGARSEELRAWCAERLVALAGFVNYVNERLTGFGGEAAPWAIADLADSPELAGEQYGGEAGAHIMPANCEGDVSYVGHADLQRDIENLKAALGDHGAAFMPAASPGVIAVCSPNQHYADYDAYLDALADAMAEEYRAIVDAGLLLQLDCPDIPMAAHTGVLVQGGSRKARPARFAARNVAAIDRALEGVDPQRVRLHVCWGNYEGPHHLDAPLRGLIEPVLAGRPGMISFEAANPRHEHEWEEFETLTLPDDKVILPGVIDTLTNFVEHPRLVAQRIERYARLVGPERVIASTDCGFGTFVGFGQVGARGRDEAAGARRGRAASARLMRIVTFEVPTPFGPVWRTGALAGDAVIDLSLARAAALGGRPRTRTVAAAEVRSDMLELLRGGEWALEVANQAVEHAVETGVEELDGARVRHTDVRPARSAPAAQQPAGLPCGRGTHAGLGERRSRQGDPG